MKFHPLSNEIRPTEPWYVRFNDLMPFRVGEILLLSTSYDAFILAEDGSLTERLYAEYSQLHLTAAPRLTHVTSIQKAIELLKTRHFDLVITMVRLEDTNVNSVGRLVKSIKPDLPVVLLVFNENDIKHFPGGIDHHAIEHCFLWRGDATILLTIIKLIEDERNATHDIQRAGVKAILVVEDSVRRYSTFLAMLYPLLMRQSNSLISEGLNDLHRRVRMRARPKILLAKNYEQAIGYYEKFKGQIITLIADVNFPRDGKEDIMAGFELAQYVKQHEPNMPILMQSAKSENAQKAMDLGLNYLNKNSRSLLRKISNFFLESLGFGDFVFRLSDRTEICRAKDMYDMKRIIKDLPQESLAYHASHNHFSIWFSARCFFYLADQMKRISINQFENIEQVREFIEKTVEAALIQEQKGVITDFSPRQMASENLFIRLGKGSVGGKGRGIAFINSMLVRSDMQEICSELTVTIPKTIAIGTGDFENFMNKNQLHEISEEFNTDEEIVARFLEADLTEELLEDLRFISKDFRRPIAIRSSSILEDSQFQPFAGIYSTYMLSNNHPDSLVRFIELCRAIKAVYASTYCRNARAYIAGTPHSSEEERMGVVIQEVVGHVHDNRYYPILSGVAQSFNYYPIGHQKAEDGIAEIALGLGHYIVSGRSALRFSPKMPQILPQFLTAEDFFKNSQHQFYALDLSKTMTNFMTADEKITLELCDLEDAETDKILNLVGSVYSHDDNTIRDNLNQPGPRIVTFNNFLKWNSVPLASTLDKLLALIRREVGFPIEIEFALDFLPGKDPILYILQMRPLATQFLQGSIETEGFQKEEIFCHTDISLGHGTLSKIYDIVYVKKKKVDRLATPQIANEVGQMNELLQKEKRDYILIGPGRWASSDPSLGIPVEWEQISGAKIIAETNFEDLYVDPSQGTHFFQNMIAKGLGYFTLSRPGGQASDKESYIDDDWLDRQPVFQETEWVRLVRFQKPLIAHLDGKHGKAVVLKPTS